MSGAGGRSRRPSPVAPDGPAYVWMTCDNCGHVDSGPDGAMYECPECGCGSGWGAESHVEAQTRSEAVRKREQP